MGQMNYGNVSPEHAAALAAALTSGSYYVEEGVSDGLQPVWCVLDRSTSEQVATGFSSPELAQQVANDWNGA